MERDDLLKQYVQYRKDVAKYRRYAKRKDKLLFDTLRYTLWVDLGYRRSEVCMGEVSTGWAYVTGYYDSDGGYMFIVPGTFRLTS